MRSTCFTILLMFMLGPDVLGQRTLITLEEQPHVGFGIGYAHSGVHEIELFVAYNGPLRAEFALRKDPGSLSGTLFGLNAVWPAITQSSRIPLNVVVEGEYQRYQSSGFSSNTYSVGGIIGHMFDSPHRAIQLYSVIGYSNARHRYDFFGGTSESRSNVRWGVGIDALFRATGLVLSLEHQRVGSNGLTFVTLGYKIGVARRVEPSTVGFGMAHDQVSSMRPTHTRSDSLLIELSVEKQLKERERIDLGQQLQTVTAQLETERALLKIKREHVTLLRQQAMVQKAEQPAPKPITTPAKPKKSPVQLNSPIAGEEVETERRYFFVQLASLSSRPVHTTLYERVIRHGSVYLFFKDSTVKVKLGFYGSRAEAMRVLSRVRNSGFSDAFISTDTFTRGTYEILIE